MVNKISQILFSPRSLIQYAKMNIFKVFVAILVLGFVSVLVMMIDLAKFDGYNLAQQQDIEEIFGIDFSVVDNFPNCSLDNEILTCDDSNQITEIAVVLGMIHIVIDPNDKMIVSDNDNYIIFTENTLLFKTRFSTVPLSYKSLPEGWSSFDFAEMKASPYPEDALTNYFITGLNQLIVQYTWMGMLMLLLFGFFSVLIKALIVGLLFTLFFKGFGHKFGSVFKVTVFAQALPILMVLITDLMGVGIFSPTILTVITFIYVYKALAPKVVIGPKNNE